MITFSAFEHLVGGAQADRFVFADGAVFTAPDGGAGSDTLDYSAYTTPVCVNLSGAVVTANGLTCQPQAAMNVSGGIADQLFNIENLVGGAGNDLLVATRANNILTATAAMMC